MYQPPHFREDRLDRQHALMVAHPLALVVSVGPDGPVANPIPFLLDAAASPLGTLRAHLARANAQWRTLAGQEVLVVFQGVNTYVTPSWYETKRQTGKVVPTWNYAIVQARGVVRVVEDRAWLGGHVAALTAAHEAPRAEPWAVSDAPAEFIDGQLKGIVGIEIPIATISGKWKVSQNRQEADRDGVAGGLRAEGGDAMAALVEAYGAG